MYHRRFAVTLSLVLTTVVLAPLAAQGAVSARWQGLPLWGGRVQVAAAPRSPEIAYAATSVAPGVYRSRDGGRSWRLSSAGPHGLAVEILAVDPHDPRRLFVTGADHTGLYRSDDEGRRWTRVDKGFGSPFVFDVDFDPVRPGRVYVATGAGQFRSGLYRSEDLGATWAPLAFHDGGVAAIAVSPVAPRVLLASAFLAPDRSAIFRSVDFGRTFEPVHEIFVSGFVFDPSRPRRVYAWRTSSDVLRSDDGGATWTALPAPFSVLELAVIRSGLLLAGTPEGVRRSFDGGTTWEPLPGSPVDAARAARPKDSIDSFAVLADAVLAGGGRGVWRGRLDGVGWKAASDGVRGQEIGVLEVAADEEATVWVSATGGFFQSRDDGATFHIRPARLALLAVHPLAPQTAYAFGSVASEGGEQFGLLKTEDGGATWRLLPYPGVTREVSVLAVDPLNPDIVYAGGDREPHASACTAVRSLDGGETWRCIAPALAGFYGLQIDPHDPRTLYAGFAVSGKRLFRSDDRGETWSPLPARGLPSEAAPLGVDPFVRGRLYAGGLFAGVYRSDDGGRTFQRKSRGLPAGGAVHDFLADPARPGRLYVAVVTFPAAAGGGVYRSDDSGDHWTEISAGLPDDAVVVRLAVDPRGADFLYAGTAGRSLYRLNVAD
ncbi:MAG TPA: hypothetical protein VNJ70_13235 [Thermoanaerobaculia bacterium]|nr:hypothetical protein [Thermoanaerobaculia bacterium]